MRGIGDLCCTTEKKDGQGENRNRPFIHRKDLPSLERRVTHYTWKSKGFLVLDIDFATSFDIRDYSQERSSVELNFGAASPSINKRDPKQWGRKTTVTGGFFLWWIYDELFLPYPMG